jgi:fumarate reductase subunit D
MQEQQQEAIQSVGSNPVRPEDKIMLVLAYLGLLSLIPLLTVKDSPFVQYHSKQGLMLFLVMLPIALLNVIPLLGWLLYCVAWVGYVVTVILGITKALKGERWAIPLVSDLAAKI